MRVIDSSHHLAPSGPSFGIKLPTGRRVKPTASSKNLPWPGWSLSSVIGVLVVLVYFGRGTVLPWFLGLSFNLLVGANLAVLLACASLNVAAGGTWRFSWVIAVVAFGLSISQSEQPLNSASRWLGLALLMLAVGPVIRNPSAQAVRQAAWVWTINGLLLLAAVFVVWYGLGLPNFGAGYFSAFMNQCMLAGPIAGMGGALALARYFRSRSKAFALLAVLAIIPVIASSSRVALLSTIVAYSVLAFRRSFAFGAAMAAVAASAVAILLLLPSDSASSNSVIAAMASKSTVNTRAELWDSRFDEFKGSPIFGIGVAMGTGGGSAVEEGGSIRVEPGSSYLAILAMTGLLGTIAFASAGVMLLKNYSRQTTSNFGRDAEIAIGTFLAVHGIAEGWVLSFGSPLAMLFWLWVGKMADSADAYGSTRRPGLLSSPSGRAAGQSRSRAPGIPLKIPETRLAWSRGIQQPPRN